MRLTNRLACSMIAAALGFACGCEEQRPQPEHAAVTAATEMQKRPFEEHQFVHGPQIATGSGLETWLARSCEPGNSPDILRLPFTLTLGRARSSVAAAALGADPGVLDLAVRVDDSALGISLADRASQACPDAARCLLWLEGTWQDAAGECSFRVVRVVRPLSAAERAGTLFAMVAVADGTRPDLVDALDRLGLDLPMAAKRESARQLAAAGKEAIPLLIASLGDGRAFEVRDTVNRLNLPATQQQPEPRLGVVTVGMRVEDLLYEIITPAVPVTGRTDFKVFSQQILSVGDWRVFWHARREKRLAEIHAELSPLVERYWATHGTTQKVE